MGACARSLAIERKQFREVGVITADSIPETMPLWWCGRCRLGVTIESLGIVGDGVGTGDSHADLGGGAVTDERHVG